MSSCSLSNKLDLTDEFHNVTLLFADIAGFTEFSHKAGTPANVVRMLRELFEKFDRVCVENKVYKLYTIGDCYVVMGFTNAAQRNEDTILSECLNVVKFGEDMIEKIHETRQKLELSS